MRERLRETTTKGKRDLNRWDCMPGLFDDLSGVLAQECRKRFDYYDVINESAEQIDYEKIISFVLQNYIDILKSCL